MYLIYQGPHLEVEVPHDDVPDGAIYATRGGPAVEFPAELAEGLLAQGHDSAEKNPRHQPQWVKASAKQIAAAKRAEEAAAAKEADEAQESDD